MDNYLLIAIIWIALGTHSAWFLVKRFTIYWDFTTKDLFMIIVAFAVPVVSHIATMMAYPKNEQEEKIIFKKRA